MLEVLRPCALIVGPALEDEQVGGQVQAGEPAVGAGRQADGPEEVGAQVRVPARFGERVVHQVVGGEQHRVPAGAGELFHGDGQLGLDGAPQQDVLGVLETHVVVRQGRDHDVEPVVRPRDP
ncbi:hypothetical protein [Georgenia sp. SYP-B2076]|uniref:hypothetical protein n=1 Tax=Georgenia sp. SYP-B2076 TaxID=2495881 RepID=UPI0013DF3ECD|nr:hypothetical protein [Georgenia sp. SYP-B2076]